MSKKLAVGGERDLTITTVRRKRHLSARKGRPKLRLPFRQGRRRETHNAKEFAGKDRDEWDSKNQDRSHDPLGFDPLAIDDSEDDDDAVTCSQPAVKVSHRSAGRFEFHEGSNNRGSSDQTCWEIQLRPPSPIGLLGTGEGDPFFALPSDLPRRFVDERLYSGMFRYFSPSL